MIYYKDLFILLLCIRLIAKQNKYPVLLLTQGEHIPAHDEYRDPRTRSLRTGVLAAEMAGLLGLSAMAEAVMRDPEQMEEVRRRGQVMFVWTGSAERNDRDTIKYLKKLGVNGVIYDR